VPLARSGFPISCASGVYRFRQPACAASDPNRGEKPHSQGAGTLRLAQSVSCSESFVISVRSYRTHSKLAVSFITPVARIYLSPFRGPSRFKSREISRAVRPATYSPKAVGQWRPRLLSSAAPPCRQYRVAKSARNWRLIPGREPIPSRVPAWLRPTSLTDPKADRRQD